MDLFEKKILDLISRKLLKRGETIAIAESVTSGLLQFAFSQMPDAAKFFQGGITSYNLGQKFKHLNVEPIHAQECNCVSEQVAIQMAKSIVEKFRSDWSIGVTGYATPVPESGNKLFCYYSIAFREKIKSSGRISHRKADPATVQLSYVKTLLKKFSTYL